MDSVNKPRRWLPGLIGAGLLLAALEAVSFFSGRGELFVNLLRMSAQ
jgi:hypothetical protein